MTIIPDPNIEITVPPLSEFDFTPILEEVPVITSPGTVSYETDRDVINKITELAEVRHDGQIIIDESVGFPVLSYASLNESLATVDSTGRITTTGTGNVGILIKSQFLTRKLTHNARTDASFTTNMFDEFVEGSLGRHLVESAVALANTEGDTNLLSLADHAGGNYAWNTNAWTAGVDWSGVSVWNSQAAMRRGLTMISPIHWVGAHHYFVGNGQTVRFLTEDNTVITRTVVNSVQIPNTDIRIGILNEAVPESIKHYKVVPANINDYTVARTSLFLMSGKQPLITTNQTRTAIASSVTRVRPVSTGHAATQYAATREELYPYLKRLVAFDSGQPAFYLINGELVILGCHLGPWSFPSLYGYISEINQAMEDLAGEPTHELTIANLTAFNDYS